MGLDLNGEIPKITLKREVELLSTRDLEDIDKYDIVYENATMDVIDWLLKNKCNTWKK